MLKTKAKKLPETREELVQHLEKLTGRTFEPSVKRWISALAAEPDFFVPAGATLKSLLITLGPMLA